MAYFTRWLLIILLAVPAVLCWHEAPAIANEPLWVEHARQGNKELEQKSWNQAEVQFRLALRNLRNHPDPATNLNLSMNLSMALCGARRFDEALDVLAEVEKNLDNVFVNKQLIHLRLQRRRRDVLDAANRQFEAILEQKKAVDLMDKDFVLESLPYLDELNALEMLYLKVGDIDNANKVWSQMESRGMATEPRLHAAWKDFKEQRRTLLLGALSQKLPPTDLAAAVAAIEKLPRNEMTNIERQIYLNALAPLFWQRVNRNELDRITLDLGDAYLANCSQRILLERVQVGSITALVEATLGNLDSAERRLERIDLPANSLNLTEDLNGFVQARTKLAMVYRDRNQMRRAANQLTALKKILATQSKVPNHSQTIDKWIKDFKKLKLPVPIN